MVTEMYPGYGNVFWGLKESIPNLRNFFKALFEKKYDSVLSRHYGEKMCFEGVFKWVFAD